MIHVLAQIVVKPGQREKVLEEFLKIVDQVRTEPGCLEYGAAVEIPSGIPVQVPIRDNVIHVIEKWESLEALRQHLQATPLQTFLQQAGPSIEQIVASVLKPVESPVQ
ncbi:putative quinol monooxygenase [Thermogutta sp.]|uniref:putative quinol monooxygenase n=1 Tax=Thermogutta sp. TaxID=1962930 RepID=UPI00321FC61D